MSLGEEQRAMLQLLLEGGESYDDLATLLGVPADQVRSRAAAALLDLAATELPAVDDLSDYLLGQAEPEAGAATESRLAANPDQLAEVRRLHARLRLLYPGARLPTLPEAGRPGATAPAKPFTAPAKPLRVPAKAPPAADPPVATTPGTDPMPPVTEPAATEPEVADESVAAAVHSEVPAEPATTPAPSTSDHDRDPPTTEAQADPSLSPQQKRLLALLTGSGLVIVVIVLALTGVFDSNDSSSGGDGETTAAQTEADSDDTALTRAVLQPQDGGQGAGVAIFGAVDEETPVLQVTARNLEPTKQGEEYSIWLYQTDEIALRLAGLEVGRNGRIATQIQLPSEALNFIVDGTLNQVDISLNRKRAYQREINASQSDSRLPHRIGTSILRGKITGPGLGTTTGGNR